MKIHCQAEVLHLILDEKDEIQLLPFNSLHKDEKSRKRHE